MVVVGVHVQHVEHMGVGAGAIDAASGKRSLRCSSGYPCGICTCLRIRAVCLGYDLICVNTTPPNTLYELRDEPLLRGQDHRVQVVV